jgi:hypothetical protein
MTHIPEGAYDREVIAVLRKALDVAWAIPAKAVDRSRNSRRHWACGNDCS